MIDLRTDFEKHFPPPADCVYNIELDHYSWISHLKSEHPFNDLWEVWQSAHARYAGELDNHDWELVSAGVWESYHVCKKCGKGVRENHDDTTVVPKSGCNVEKR